MFLRYFSILLNFYYYVISFLSLQLIILPTEIIYFPISLMHTFFKRMFINQLQLTLIII